MPTYQYACTACGEPLEAVQAFTDEPLTECPRCGGRLRKVFSAVGVVFKGSGFYKTDSRNGTKPAQPVTAGRDGKDGGQGGNGTDAKRARSGAAAGGEGRPAGPDRGPGSAGAGSSGSDSHGAGAGSGASAGSGSGSGSRSNSDPAGSKVA